MGIDLSKRFLYVLIALLILLITQNVFLVLKNARLNKRLDATASELYRSKTIQEGDSVHAILVMQPDGRTDSLLPPDGRGRLLFVFVSWCRACAENMDAWRNLYAIRHKFDLEVVALTPDSIGRAVSYLAESRLECEVFSLIPDSGTVHRYRLLNYPMTILLSSGGVVKGVWIGVLRSWHLDQIQQKAARPAADNQKHNKPNWRAI